MATPWSLEIPTLGSESLVYFWGVKTSQSVRENPLPPVFLGRSAQSRSAGLTSSPQGYASSGGLQDGSTGYTVTPSHLHATDELKNSNSNHRHPAPCPEHAGDPFFLQASARDPGPP